MTGGERPPGALSVPTSLGRTDVTVGGDLVAVLREAVLARDPVPRRVGLVVDAGLAPAWGERLEALARALPDPVRIEVTGGEPSKERAPLERLQDALLELRRLEPVLVLGGGAALDVAGFAAATVRRGLPWIACPTTVVAMADAAIGGKVAVNHRRGKNLLGTFHVPERVHVDASWLETLGPRDTAAGLAEIYKAARIDDAVLAERLREGVPADPDAWEAVILRAVGVKARLVSEDLRDHGVRRALNLGHTVGHALERLPGRDPLRHGEAVAVGMVAAAHLASARGLLAPGEVEALSADLERLGLPVAAPPEAGAEAVLELLGADKKRRPGALHTFVLPLAPVGVRIVDDVTDAEIREALQAVAARPRGASR